MPVLGAASSSATAAAGVVGKGFIVPAGSLDRCKAALLAARSGTGLAEIVGIGDSTTYGASTGTPGFYSWLQQLSDRLLAAGIPDGGAGYQHVNDDTFATGITLTHDGVYPRVVSKAGLGPGVNLVGSWRLASGNGTDQVTAEAPATRIRLFFGRTPVSGKVAYSVDGGAETIVDLLIPNHDAGTAGLDGAAYDTLDPILITGLTAGVHQLKVRSAGLSSIRVPTYGSTVTGAGRVQNAQLQNAGTLTVSQALEYGVTVTQGTGESTLVTIPGTFTPGTGGATFRQFYVQVVNDYGYGSVNLYRRNAGTGAYGLVKTASAGSPGAVTAVIDDGSVAPGVAPPATSTLGLNPTGTDVDFWMDWLNSSGVVVHRFAFNGASALNFFDTAGNNGSTAATTPAHLGLLARKTAPSAGPYIYGRAQGAKPQFRDPCLLLVQIGTNNFGSTSTPMTDAKLAAYTEDLHGLIRTARAAGSDVILVSPSYWTTAEPGNQRSSGQAKMAMAALAQATGVAYVDFDVALGPVNGWTAKGYQPLSPVSGPHLNKVAYQAEADFLYDKVIAPLLA